MENTIITGRAVFAYIQSDCLRYYGKYDIGTIVRAYLKNSTFRWQCAYRLCRGKGIIKYIGYILWVINRSRKRIQIPRITEIGFGLYIGHGGPIIVNPTTKIGNNCNLSQFTTIGANEGQAATIGNDVYIGPGVSIVENVVIGDKVTIGAGSVVTKDIPDNATAVGNYAKVINYNNPGRYINDRWENLY